jgi:hypothetical protein
MVPTHFRQPHRPSERNLHDDFSQGLAVLGMEIAKLASRPPPYSQELSGQLLELTGQIGTWRKTSIGSADSSTRRSWTILVWWRRSGMNVAPSLRSTAFRPNSIPKTSRGLFLKTFRYACTGLLTNACETPASTPMRAKFG